MDVVTVAHILFCNKQMVVVEFMVPVLQENLSVNVLNLHIALISCVITKINTSYFLKFEKFCNKTSEQEEQVT